MLPAGSRLRRRADFTSTLRRSRGVRAGGLLVVHVAAADPADPSEPAASRHPQVGFVVSRAVGPAVTRNRVRRRLRHLAAGRLGGLPAGVRVVVRALPASATATFSQLDVALARALEVPPKTRPPTRPTAVR
ncbi:MAG: ribonuclease P protein component [Spirochaetaceae bacterium]|nr:ribonuclease P protein component [Spirochaetaceae bacterium]